MEQKHEGNSSMQSSSSAAVAPSSFDDAIDDGIINVEEYLKSFPPGYRFWPDDDAIDDGIINVEEYLKSFPPGFRFWPEDIELVVHYLRHKVNNEPLPPNVIPDVKFYDYDPPNLTKKYQPLNETDWYFFTPRYKKYPNGARPDRSTPGGYWKPTGTDKPIPTGSGNPLGCKNTLDFYLGKQPKGEKTDWKMHEYTLKAGHDNPQQSKNRDNNDMMLDAWVLCKLYKKRTGKNGDDHEENDAATDDQQPPSSITGGDHESNAATTTPDQQPTSVNASSSLAMLQGNNDNEPTGIVASIGEASSSNLMLHGVEFEDEAALIQPIPDHGLLHDDPQMIFNDLDPIVHDTEFWEEVVAYCSTPNVPSPPAD